MLSAALKYALIGWRVFPLAPGQKTPITAHGVKDATTSEHQIREWWTRWPNANIGFACGEGIYVIDVDVDVARGINGMDSLAEFPDLPATVLQSTPRGGFHAFYRTEDYPRNKNGFRKGIDIRGDGYYVVLAPSVHPNGGSYMWSPGCAPWDRPIADFPDFMRPPTAAPWLKAPQVGASSQDKRASLAVDGSHGCRPGDILSRASLYLATCDAAVQGNAGHDKLFWAASALVHGFLLTDSQALDLLIREYNPRCCPPWDFSIPSEEKDFKRKVAEARRCPPDKPAGWLLDDTQYSRRDVEVDVDAMLAVRCHETEIAGQYKYDMEHHAVMATGLLGELCSWINSRAIKDQPILTLGCAISFLGALFGRKIRDEYGNRTNIYCMGIAPSSAGKANAMESIRLLCTEAGCDSLLGGDGVASDAALESRVEREPSTLYLWDEAGFFFANAKSGANQHLSQVIPTLMRMYSAAGSIYKGREYADGELQRSIVQPCCCVYGTSTPDKYTGGLTTDQLQDGWLSRCMIFQSNKMPEKNRGVRKMTAPTELIEKVAAWFGRSVEPECDGHSLSQYVTTGSRPAPPQQIVVKATPKANDVFESLENEAIEILKSGDPLACVWAKAEENARKVALIVAAGNYFELPVIGSEEAEYACSLVRMILSDFRRNVAPEIADSKEASTKLRLLSIIRKYGVNGCTKVHLTRASQWLKKRERNDCLEDLIESNLVAFMPVKTQGRPALTYWSAENYAKYIETAGEFCDSDTAACESAVSQ